MPAADTMSGVDDLVGLVHALSARIDAMERSMMARIVMDGRADARRGMIEQALNAHARDFMLHAQPQDDVHNPIFGMDEIPSETTLQFSGTAYVCGYKTTGLNTYPARPWIRCIKNLHSAVEHAGPPPLPMPANEEWYEKANTYGDIHCWLA